MGTVHDIVSEIGTDGIVGVKSGYTSQASGCMVLAGFRSVDGRTVLVLASALGQREPAPTPPPSSTASPAEVPTRTAASAAPTTTTTAAPYSAIQAKYPLRYTEPIVEHLLDDSEAAIVLVPVVTAGSHVGTAGTEWGRARLCVPVVAATAPGCSVSRASGWLPHGLGGTVRSEDRRPVGGRSPVHPGVPDRDRAGAAGSPRADPGWWWKVLHN